MKAFEYTQFMNTAKCILLSKQIAEKVNAVQLAERMYRLYEIKNDAENETTAPEANFPAYESNDLLSKASMFVSATEATAHARDIVDADESQNDSSLINTTAGKKRMSSALLSLKGSASKISRAGLDEDVRKMNPFSKKK